MKEVIDFTTDNWEIIALIVTGIVALTPTEKDNTVWDRAKNIITLIIKSKKKEK